MAQPTEGFTGRLVRSTFFSVAHWDLTIEWDESNHAAMVEQIEALQQKGVTFHKLAVETTGTIRKKTKTTATPISGVGDASNRKLLIKDPDIAKIVESGLASLARFEGVGEVQTIGIATAAEAATQDTVAIQPAKGG